MKRTPFLSLALVFVLPATDGLAEPKKNEIFGFGRNRNQISNALFPGGTATGTGPAPAAAEKPEVKRDSDTIFRGGKPKKVESAAYLIKDGEKIEQPLPEPKAKPSLFSKFKKGSAEDSPLMTATNGLEEKSEKKANPILPPISLKKEKKEDPILTTPVPSAVEAEREEEVTESAFTAAPMEEKAEEKKSGGLFSFFNRDKKKDDVVPTAAPIDPIPAPVTEAPETVAMTTAPAAPTSADIPDAPGFEESAPATPKPRPAPAAPTAPAPVAESADEEADVPLFAGAPKPEKAEKEKKGFSLPNPIAALKPEPKPVSMVGAETIIENGEIVEEQEDIVESNIVRTGDGKKDPPRIVDGVKTYNSWEDVEGRNVSAADRILSQMRQR